MTVSRIKSFAKINIHLGVLGKLKNNLHKIETIVFFLNLHDKIAIKQIKSQKHKISFSGKFSKGIGKNNTISSLMKILDKDNLLNNKKFSISIKKNIPLKSGMGGGSMNASSVLVFFYKKKMINIKKKSLINICNQISSDSLLGINNHPKLLNLKGRMINLSNNFKIYLTIIKPKFGCNTTQIYSQIKKFSKPYLKNKKKFNYQDLKYLQNDLEPIALKLKPKLKLIKKSLISLPNISFARMTGSGSTFIGYFSKNIDALRGTKLLKKKYKNCWCISSKTI